MTARAFADAFSEASLTERSEYASKRARTHEESFVRVQGGSGEGNDDDDDDSNVFATWIGDANNDDDADADNAVGNDEYDWGAYTGRRFGGKGGRNSRQAPLRTFPNAGNAEDFWRLRDPAFSDGDEREQGARAEMPQRQQQQPRQRRLQRRQQQQQPDDDDESGVGPDEARFFYVPADKCPLCWEQQMFVMRNTQQQHGTGDVQQAKTAMLQKIDDYRRVIFDLERSLRTMQNDSIIWEAMLLARRTYIEKHLDAYGVPYTRWTREMLARHYDVRNEHTFDLERSYRTDERDMRRMQAKIVKQSLYIRQPGAESSGGGVNSAAASGGGTAVNLRAAEMILKLSKRRQELNKAIDDCVKGRAEDTQANSRQLISLLQSTAARENGTAQAGAGREGGADGADEPLDVIADMYEVGGI